MKFRGSKSKASPLTSVEKNEMVLIKQGDISWTVPDEDLSGYTYCGIADHEVACHIQEIPENGADGAHLQTVHAPFVVGWLTGVLGELCLIV